MLVKHYSYVKEHLEELIKQVNEDNTVITITAEDRNAILMSEDNYNEMMDKINVQKI